MSIEKVAVVVWSVPNRGASLGGNRVLAYRVSPGFRAAADPGDGWVPGVRAGYRGVGHLRYLKETHSRGDHPLRLRLPEGVAP